MFHAIANAVVRRPRITLAIWALVLLFGVLFAPRLQQVFEREFVTGNAGEAQAAADLVSSRFTDRTPFQQLLVLSSDRLTVDDPAYRQAAESVTAAIDETGLTRSIDSYFSAGDERLVSDSRRTTYALLNLRSTTHADAMSTAGDVIDRVAEAGTPAWLRAYVTGEEATHADITSQSRSSMQRAEMVGLPVALAVLVVVFGALVAAVMPLIIGVISIIVALALAFVVGQFMDLSVFLESFATMIGLGVGIDYSLFLLTRYRAERAAGRAVDAAVVETVVHAGKAVAFSGLAVMIGLFALLATGEPTVISIGLGGVLVVLVAVAAAVTLLPALLVLVGDRVEAPAGLSRAVRRIHRGGFWSRWAMRTMRRPWLYATVGLGLIVVLAWPTLQLRTGALGVRVLGESAQSRQGFEVIASEFAPGVMSPVQVVVDAPGGVDAPGVVAGVDRLTRAIRSDGRFAGAVSMTSLAPGMSLDGYQAIYANGFAGVPDPLRGPLGTLVNLRGGGDTSIVLAYLPEGPDSDSSAAGVRALRDEIIPSITELSAERVVVGGTTALQMDVNDALYARFPIVIGLILAATFLLLMVLFRSILIPLKAVVMNLFSVFAAYGLLVLVFQWGVGDSLLGFDSIGSINWITPVLLFAILFGLSMDYEVFLMSRIRELHDRGRANEESVAAGLERTGGVITGAAAIMVVIFASFMLSPLLLIKELGFALAAAILIDATVVRMVLVPSMMRLFGERNWWLPAPLRRLLPEVELERDISESPAG